MPGFITTDDGGWEFRFDDPIATELPVHDPFEQQGPEIPSYLDKPDHWKNYSDMVLYELELLLRKFFKSKEGEKNWEKGNAYMRKYTCSMMFEQLYGRKVSMSNKDDLTRLRRLPKLLSYYSTRVQKCGSIRGRKTNKTIYTLSLRMYRNRPPYSLRLRIEWLSEQGKLPVWQNMKLPNDDLKPGHARNKRTDENMRARREKARQLYNERYADRAR